MKKIYITFSIMLLFLFGFSKSTYTEEGNPIEININFNGKGCTVGRGTCKFDLPNENARSTYDAKGNIYLNEQGKITLEINKATISVAKFQEQFFDGKFVLEDDFKLSNELMTALNIREEKSTLRKGNYALTETNDKYVITF